MCEFIRYVPEKSIKILKSWINELEVNIKITNARKTKLETLDLAMVHH